MQTERVLLIGDALARTRMQSLLPEQTRCIFADGTVGSLQLLRSHPDIEMAVLCVAQSLSPYAELCRLIKFDARTQFLAVVVILPPDMRPLRAEAYAAGADDCIQADAPPDEIALRLRKAIELKHATDSLEDASAVIRSLAGAIEGKDHYTCGHVERVGDYCLKIGRRLGLGTLDMAALKVGGVVHDIGKIGVPDQILNKPGKLTDEEFAVIQRHPVIGYDILKPLRTFQTVLPIVRWHHERPNGKGYPDGIGGADLPLLPRITSVADCFDALTTDRPYRPAFPLPKALDILNEDAASGRLDGELVAILSELCIPGTPLQVESPAA